VKDAVAIINKQKLVGASVPLLKKLVALVLAEHGAAGREIDIVLVDDAYIKTLNRTYLGRSCATDVLSFGFEQAAERIPECVLGDVVVSTERAFFRAAEFGKDIAEETCLYVIHGVLHLLGFDDERKQAAQRMRREEERMLALARARYGDGFFRKAVRLKKQG